MKNYTIGLVTGILLTASALMFMGAKKSQSYDFQVIDRHHTFLTLYTINKNTGEVYKTLIDKSGQSYSKGYTKKIINLIDAIKPHLDDEPEIRR